MTNPVTADGAPQSAILFLHAQTSLHPGSGTALGVVDLPIQRERHTQWPLIPGTSLKGVLRDCCRPLRTDNDKWQQWLAVFGPDTGNAADHAGALSISDARILAFPVRSLRGVFAWVTCHETLKRFHRDLHLVGQEDSNVDDLCNPADTECACKKEFGDKRTSPLLLDGNKLVLEEYDFTWRTELSDAVIRPVQQAADEFTQEQLAERLVVLSNDYFTHFVQHATEVVARIALDAETKTVKGQALFYEEFVPAETLFYSLAFPEESRRKFKAEDESEGRKTTALSRAQVIDFVKTGLRQRHDVIQIGGGETTGKGLCKVRLYTGKEEYA